MNEIRSAPPERGEQDHLAALEEATKFLEKNLKNFFSYCKKLKGGVVPEAQDLCQEVLLKVWKRINAPDWGAKLSMAYLVTAAKNAHNTDLRNRPPGENVSLNGTSAVDASFEDGEPALNAVSLSRHRVKMAEERAEEVTKARLDKLERAINSGLSLGGNDLHLLELAAEGKSDCEIAEILHLDKAAVTYRRQLVIKKVKYHLGQLDLRLKKAS